MALWLAELILRLWWDDPPAMAAFLDLLSTLALNFRPLDGCWYRTADFYRMLY